MGISREQLVKLAQQTAPKFTVKAEEPKKSAGARVLGGALKIIDQIERPYYSIMNVGKDIVGGPEGFHPLRSAYKGFSLKEKTDFSDILTEAGWQPETMVGKIGKGGVAFVGGVLLDPITYLTFGTGRGLKIGGQVLSKYGTGKFLKNLGKESGVKFTDLKDIKKFSNKFTNEQYFKAAEKTRQAAISNPDVYFNKTTMKFAGKEMTRTTDALKGMGRSFHKVVEPVLNTRVTREISREGKVVGKSLGEMFSPGYDIRHSTKLNPTQKSDLLWKMEEQRAAKAWLEMETINDTRLVFKGMGKREREQVAYEAEKFLNKERKLTAIKNPKVRKVVGTFQEKMKSIWDEEVKMGLRTKGAPIDSGYVKRILVKATSPDINKGFYEARKLGVPNIKRAKELYQQGKLPYMFETDAAKLYAERINQSNVMAMNKMMVNWMKENKFIQAMKKGVKKNDEMTQIDLWGKKYQMYPEIAREMQKVAPQLTDTGLRSFLKTYDKIQNIWKLSVTSIWPSFHARNAVSNVWLSWLGGNKNPLTYQLANKVQWYGHNLKLGKKAKDEVIELYGRKFKLSEVWRMGGESGVIGTGWMGGDFIKKLAIKTKNPVQGLAYYTRLPRRLGTAVENNARIATFMDRLAKGDDVMSAAQHTKKFLFDYGHLTEFERKVMKRFVPFYTWLRKNIALQLEQVVKQPGKYAAMVHAQRGVESMTPAQEEKFLPHWMKEEELYVRLPGKKYWNPDLPFQDLARVTLSDKIIGQIVGPITPLIKGVFEIAANKDIFRGKPLADQRLPKSKFAREKVKQEVMNNLRFTTMYKRATKGDRSLLEKFLDLVFGINVTIFDVQQGRKFYQIQKSGERKALRKLNR